MKTKIIGQWVLYFVLSFIVFAFLLEPYADLMKDGDHGPLTFALYFLLLGSVLLGWYVSRIYVDGRRKVTAVTFYWLIGIVLVGLIILFFHAQSLYIRRHSIRNLPINLLISWIWVVAVGISAGLLVRLARFSVNNEIQVAKASAAQSLSELHFLQSQLSPHFLFNTLNNLYGISLAEPVKIPNLLLRLSDLLRYAVYEAKTMYVPLSDEIGYINNYIEFEKLRVGSRIDLHTEIEQVTDRKIVIPPLLLIVFIENAFKHAKNTTTDKLYISIVLKTFGKDILFSVTNSYNSRNEHQGLAMERERDYSGLGLENVQKRLELLYPDKYDWHISKEPDQYKVTLHLKHS
ncbi:sensor histidine kinase [Gynurincola endophyticus]|uniref:sensor histidine kinase n=1 Tax=Gynurincola endophyticus TaxID=2479004 RepID=UPI000F8D924B|nr:histidine kinase [Gynurincola endophyticus]